MKFLGPFTSGEIPEPLVVTFTDDGGAPLPLTDYDARWITQLGSGEPETRDAQVTDADAGQATYTWVEGDLAEPGPYRAEMWVGNGANRFASVRFVFRVRAALAVPDI